LNYQLSGWNSKYRDGLYYWNNKPVNKYHNNFKISYPFNPTNLTKEEIKEIIKDNSMRLGRGFGHENDYCIDEQGNINVEQIHHLVS